MTELRGKFIVFDGGEGCGKSTQAKMLETRLQQHGVDVLNIRDPGTTRIGEMIRAILLNPDHLEMAMRCEMLLYMAARAQMMKETIQPALDAGRLVISDRFVSSTLSYQLGGDGLTSGDIRAVAEVTIAGRWPDLTLILDMPVAVSRSRVQAKYEHRNDTLFGKDVSRVVKDRIEQRSVEYHEQVRDNYLKQVQADPSRYQLIAADRQVQEVHEDIWAAVTSGK